jgi:class 3 adenylate cyclase/tetratricopeptide (TPR) repeat protein
VICDTCGTANQAGANFCIQCGTRLATGCPVCGHANLPAAHFCANCGSELPAISQPAPGASAAPPIAMAVAERRLVSVLFADLVGFTTASEDRDPEETRELLSRYFEVARRIVEGHGGTIEKFIGDAVMAVWGAPTAHEDDAERAVRSALAIVAGVGSIADGDQPLHARAAVLTGEAAVTVGAEAQGMVAGDLVNTASRLQGVAQPGTVLVGEATYRATSNAISYEAAGERVLKGKTAPIPAWRAVAVVARRGGSGRASTLEPPFVGREDELQQLKDLFDATGRERKPRLVTVIGQAGIGKSRLAWEFEKYLDGVVETAFWHEGRTPAYGEGISYWALAEMVRLRAQITEGEAPESARPKLTAMLEQFVDDPEERRFVEPRLAGLLGLAELPSDGREELFAAWRTLFERIAAQAPTVLVFVDLHWADQGLLDFVEDLLAWARTSPIFVVALARPELLERRPDWGSAVRSVTRINLEPLAAPEMAQLLDGLVPGLPEQAVTRIVERSEGIPLYAVETVRMLLDTGAVVPEEDHYVLHGDLSELAVAETLHALIAARLDANSPEDRSLIQDGAVLGLSFTLEALAAVSGRDVAQLQEPLDRLTRRQLLMPDNDPRSPERGQHRFVQALLREVAYQSLAKPDRRTRHLAAARYFETLNEGELAGVLATHYLDAFRESRPGPEADALAAQARVALLAAADRAISLHSHRQALNYLEQALTVTQDPAQRGAIHERIVVSSEYAGLIDMPADHGRRAMEAYREAGDEVGRLRAATAMARDLIGFHLEDEAAAALEAAIGEARPLGQVPELAGAYTELARSKMLRELHQEAVDAADQALRMGAIVRPETVVEALVTKGTSMTVLQRTVEAEAIMRGAIHLADDLGLISSGLRARNNLSGPLSFRDQAEARRMIRDGYDVAARFGHRPFVYQFLFAALEADLRSGKWDDSLTDLDAVEENETPWPFYRISFGGMRAIRDALRGDLAAAEQMLGQIEAAMPAVQSMQVEAYVNQVRSHVHFVAGRWDEAIEHGRKAAANSNFTIDAWWITANAAAAADDRATQAEAMDGIVSPASFPGPIRDALFTAIRAALAGREGRWDDARTDFRTSIGQLTTLEMLYAAHLTGLLWDELARDRDPTAAEAGRSAVAFFEQNRASAFVDRYRAAFVPSGSQPTPRPAGVETLAEA